MDSYQEPACHSYLGDNFEDVKNRNILEPDNVYELLLVPMNGIILFPNETLPLRIQNPNFIAHIRRLFDVKADIYGQVKEEIHHLGILNVDRHYGLSKASVGTTMEIRTKSKESLQVGNADEIILTGKGRYRFKLLSVRRENQVSLGRVLILRDEAPRNIHILKKMQSFPSWVYNSCHPSALAIEAYKLFTTSWVLEDSAHQQILRRWGPLSANPLTDSKISADSESFTTLKLREFYGAELDPIGFSYFLSANLSIANEDLQRLLEAQDVIERLRLAIDFLKNSAQKSLGCEVCQTALAAKSEVFSLPGAEGMVGAYVNPHGAVHQTVTVRQMLHDNRVMLEGRPCAKDSWFPGYAWTIAYCSHCYNHLGWKFTLVNSASNADEENDDSDDDVSDDDDVLDEDSVENSSADMSYEEDRDPLESASDEEEDNDDILSESTNTSMQDTRDSSVPSTALPHLESSRETMTQDGRVVQFWGLRRSALKEV